MTAEETKAWQDAVNKAATDFVQNHKDEAVRSMFGHHFRTFVQGAIWQEEYASERTKELEKENEAIKSTSVYFSKECARLIDDNRILTELYEKSQAENARLRKLLKAVLPMAEDGYTLHKKNGSHQEFLSEDRELLSEIRSALSSVEDKLNKQ